MFILQPKVLPSKGYNCIYLFGGGRLVKVGMTTNLISRDTKYKNLECLAYIGPIPSDRIRYEEFKLKQHFSQLFARYSGQEWFVVSRLSDAVYAFAMCSIDL